jgi:hypothetical protein
MQGQTITRAVVAAVAIAAAGVVLLLARSPGDEPPPAVVPSETPPPAQKEARIALAPAEPVVPPDAELAAAKVRELEAMSETFRNTTFLIAIRDSGFVCNELLRVYGGIDASAKWMATCSEMHAYSVGVASTGQLQVAPTLQYFDGQWPQVIQTFEDPTLVLPRQPRLPAQRLPPQELPPQPQR